ncbi:MAG: oxidoreductase, partial [Mycobacteriales bacterium]
MGWDKRAVGDLDGQVVVVTGGNSGVGLEAARVLGAHGARVFVACRDKARGEEAAHRMSATARLPVSFVALDLADLDSVAGCAEELAGRLDRLDVLVNNAGVMAGPRMATAQGFERQMGTNHLGHFALTARLWPLLAATPGGRVVTVSSIAARGGSLGPGMSEQDLVDPQPYRAQQVYSNTKQANLLFTLELHRRAVAAGVGVRAVSAHPGVSYTNLMLRQLSEEGRGWAVPVARVVGPVVLQSAAAGALPTVRAATDPGVSGGAFVGPRRFHQARGAPELLEVYPPGRDGAAATRLWALSEKLTGA